MFIVQMVNGGIVVYQRSFLNKDDAMQVAKSFKISNKSTIVKVWDNTKQPVSNILTLQKVS